MGATCGMHDSDKKFLQILIWKRVGKTPCCTLWSKMDGKILSMVFKWVDGFLSGLFWARLWILRLHKCVCVYLCLKTKSAPWTYSAVCTNQFCSLFISNEVQCALDVLLSTHGNSFDLGSNGSWWSHMFMPANYAFLLKLRFTEVQLCLVLTN
jgi:hypothetical protein